MSAPLEKFTVGDLCQLKGCTRADLGSYYDSHVWKLGTETDIVTSSNALLIWTWDFLSDVVGHRHARQIITHFRKILDTLPLYDAVRKLPINDVPPLTIRVFDRRNASIAGLPVFSLLPDELPALDNTFGPPLETLHFDLDVLYRRQVDRLRAITMRKYQGEPACLPPSA